MAQQTIFEFLRTQRRAGNQKFWSIKEITQALKDNNDPVTNIGKQVNKLYAWGYLDISLVNHWHRFFRVKLEYLEDFEQSKFFKEAEIEAKTGKY